MDDLVADRGRTVPQQHLDYLDAIVEAGGPQESEYQLVSDVLDEIYLYSYSHENGQSKILENKIEFDNFIARHWKIFSTPASMQGFVRSKPNGYAGDFEIIERIYNKNVSGLKEIYRWDKFFYYSSAVKAVRARGNVLRSFVSSQNPESLLSVGAGPGLDVCQALSGAGKLRTVALLDNDPRAIERARTNIGIHIKHSPRSRVEPKFFERNALRFRTEQKFDLIWSSGLFDYLNDKVFVFLLAKLRGMMVADGMIVVGNFSENNPDRAYMELVGEWFLIHRTEADLIRLGQAAGFNPEQLSVTSDPTGVNLYLVVRGFPFDH